MLVSELTFPPESPILIHNKQFLYSFENKIILGNTASGKISDEIAFNGKISGLTKSGNLLYMWLPNIGVTCFNLETKKSLWNFKPDKLDYINMEFILDECLYFSAGDFYCIDLYDGDLYWRTDGNCSKYMGNYSRVIGNYVLRYNTCTSEGDFFPELIELLDKKTGEISFRGWASEIYPEKDDGFIEINDMDAQGSIIFANKLCNGMLIGIRKDSIYGFKFLGN